MRLRLGIWKMLAYHAMEGAAFVSAFLELAGAEPAEVLRCGWDDVHEQLHLDPPDRLPWLFFLVIRPSR
jgi:hypothetical protein